MESKKEEYAIQSYFEARANIVSWEQRQHGVIQFYLGASTAVVGAWISLLQIVNTPDQAMISLFGFTISCVLSLAMYALACSLMLTVARLAVFCRSVIQTVTPGDEMMFWETWVKSSRDPTQKPRTLEATLAIFLMPVLLSFGICVFFAKDNGLATILAVVFLVLTVVGLIIQYRRMIHRLDTRA